MNKENIRQSYQILLSAEEIKKQFNEEIEDYHIKSKLGKEIFVGSFQGDCFITHINGNIREIPVKYIDSDKMQNMIIFQQYKKELEYSFNKKYENLENEFKKFSSEVWDKIWELKEKVENIDGSTKYNKLKELESLEYEIRELKDRFS